jgi:flagellar FliJ protein
MKPFSLKPIADLAQDELEQAACQLSELRARLDEEQAKLDQLLAYKDEYRAKLFKTTWTGMTAARLRDFEAFLAKLAGAVNQQELEVARRRQAWQAGQQEWLAKQRKVSAYDTLSQRHQQRELQREAKVEQREQDEHARKLFHSARRGGSSQS